MRWPASEICMPSFIIVKALLEMPRWSSSSLSSASRRRARKSLSARATRSVFSILTELKTPPPEESPPSASIRMRSKGTDATMSRSSHVEAYLIAML